MNPRIVVSPFERAFSRSAARQTGGVARLLVAWLATSAAACGSGGSPPGKTGSGGRGGPNGSGGGIVTGTGGAAVPGTGGTPGTGGAASPDGSGGGGRGTGGAASGGGGGGGPFGNGGNGGSNGSGLGGRNGGAGGGSASGGRGGSGGPAAGGGNGAQPTWTTQTLSTMNFGEGADVGDIDGDGVLDLVGGPNWYRGPTFTLGGSVMPNPPTYTRTQYSPFFLTFVDDVDGDGSPDVIQVGDAGGVNGTGNPNAFWYQNPGAPNLSRNMWTRRTITTGLVSNEAPIWTDLVGDQKKELVFIWCETTGTGSCPSGRLVYARPGATAADAWTVQAIGGSFSSPWVHGLGVGDIDGDGKNDVIERTGWWRQVSATSWERHAFDFWIGPTSGRPNNWGGGQMYAYDVDGDGDNDVVTSLAAHQYGLGWFEHQKTGGAITFVAHEILPTAAGANNVSQLHAVAVADVNRDGLPDIITGKRYYAHDNDPGAQDAPYLMWFELTRGASGATFTRRNVHADSGVGCNFVARDLNGDGTIDIFTASKRGIFVHLQR